MASQEYATQKTSIDAQALINDAPISKYQWLIAIVCFLIVFVDGIDTAAMGFIAPALAQDWGIDRSQLGPVMSAALGGMIIGALVSGPTADRFGRKIVLSVSMLIFGGFTLASAYATDLNTLVILRFLTGIGLGAAMPNATTLFSEYCPQRSRSLLVTCNPNLWLAQFVFTRRLVATDFDASGDFLPARILSFLDCERS
jgi:AAHS family 4-hydroxybenzoate transporter-like MFS transporter